MYLIGAEHPNKAKSQRQLESYLLTGKSLVTNAEVFQEILHRYVAINRLEAIGPAFDLLRSITVEVYPVELADVVAAKEVLERGSGLTARDAIHVATMRRRGISEIFSFDNHFDDLDGIHRIH